MCIQYCVETPWINYILYISSKCTTKANHIIIKCQRKCVPHTFILSSLPASWLVTVFNAHKQNKHTFAVHQRRAAHGSSDWSHNCNFMHNTDHDMLSTQYTVLSWFFREAVILIGKYWLLFDVYLALVWRILITSVLMKCTSGVWCFNETVEKLFPFISNTPSWSRRYCWYLFPLPSVL